MMRGLNIENIKLVIDALRDHECTWTELKKLGIADKSLERILKNYLQYWGLVDKVGDHWFWYQYAKVFDTENDRRLAIDHSQKLLTHIHESGRNFNELNVLKVIDTLVCVNSPSLDIESIRKHLRTGYYHEIYDYMEQYRKLLNKYGLSRITAYPIITVSEFELAQLDEIIEISEIANFPIGIDPKDNDDVDRDGIETVKHMEKEALIEILNLLSRIATRFISLLFSIENGNPLRGTCDYCPHTSVK